MVLSSLFEATSKSLLCRARRLDFAVLWVRGPLLLQRTSRFCMELYLNGPLTCDFTLFPSVGSAILNRECNNSGDRCDDSRRKVLLCPAFPVGCEERSDEDRGGSREDSRADLRGRSPVLVVSLLT